MEYERIHKVQVHERKTKTHAPFIIIIIFSISCADEWSYFSCSVFSLVMGCVFFFFLNEFFFFWVWWLFLKMGWWGNEKMHTKTMNFDETGFILHWLYSIYILT